jgi:NADH:ubiquinone oxidoreductase subunit E
MGRDILLGMIQGEQEERGYISEEAMVQMAQSMGISVGDVYGVTTFYSFLSTEPLGIGRNVIRICKSVPCWLRDAPMIMESVRKVVGIGPGGTTLDRMFSFQLTNCIGACDMAPAMLINDEVYGDLTPGKIAEILRSFE